MNKKIEQKIVGYSVVNPSTEVEVEAMNEGIARPEMLVGSTYKIKPPHMKHALYVTINDMVLGDDRHPYEIFINSKNMDSFQWVLALTRLISAIWRKGGNTDFLIDELKAVFSPEGGYYKKGGKFMPSVVSEIGTIIEKHLGKGIKLDEVQKEFIATKTSTEMKDCPECGDKTAVIMDGCLTCTSCGFSKCN